MLFGIHIPKITNVRGLVSKTLQVFLNLYKVIWIISLIFYIMPVVYGALKTNAKIFYVHVADVVFVNILWYLVTLRIKETTKLIARLNVLLRRDINEGISKIILIIMAILSIASMVFHACRSFLSPEIFTHMQSAGMFIFPKQLTQSSMQIVLKCVVNLLIGCSTAIFFALPSLAAMLCYISYMRMRNLLNKCLQQFKIITPNEYNMSEVFGVMKDLSETVYLVKEFNRCLSPVVFILVSFWTTGIFYNLSKLLSHSFFTGAMTFVSAGVNILSYSLHFGVLIILASRIPATIADVKSLMLQSLHSRSQVFIGSVRVESFSLLMSTLDNFEREVTVTALGVMELKRNILLVSLGVILTYEVMIVQVLERK